MTLVLEPDVPISSCKERIVATTADVKSGLERRSTLSNQNRPIGDKLATESLHAESLSVAVAAVATAPLSLLVCHIYLGSAYFDLGDPHARQGRAVTECPPPRLPTLFTEDSDLRPALLAIHDAFDPSASYMRCSGEEVSSVLVDEQDLVESNLIAHLTVESVDGDDAISYDMGLPASVLDDRVHVTFLAAGTLRGHSTNHTSVLSPDFTVKTAETVR